MKTFILLTMLIAPAIAFAGAQQAPVEINFQWSLSLAADGQITSLVPITTVYKPIVREQLEPIVRGWHFTPGKLDDKPVATETTLTMHAALDPAGAETYRVRVMSAVNGGGIWTWTPAKISDVGAPHGALWLGVVAGQS